MNMYVIISTFTILLAATVLADQDNTTVKRRRRPMGKPSGGIVEKRMESKVLRIRDTTGLLPVDKVEELTRSVRYAALLPIEVVRAAKPEGCPFAAADALVSEKGVAAGVLVVNTEKLPIFLSSADHKWTILNVTTLKVDKPTPEKLLERFTKVYWMAIARTLGAGFSSYPGCVLVPFSTVRELDAIKVTRPCPEPFNKMLDTGHAYGMKTLSIASYRTACEQGWAEQPKNAVQQGIWDEVHKLPTEPLKIKPETKKVEK